MRDAVGCPDLREIICCLLWLGGDDLMISQRLITWPMPLSWAAIRPWLVLQAADLWVSRSWRLNLRTRRGLSVSRVRMRGRLVRHYAVLSQGRRRIPPTGLVTCSTLSATWTS